MYLSHDFQVRVGEMLQNLTTDYRIKGAIRKGEMINLDIAYLELNSLRLIHIEYRISRRVNIYGVAFMPEARKE